MAKTVTIVHEAADFGEAPEYLAQWEVLLGGPRTVKVYRKLRDPIMDGKMVRLKDIGAALGMSSTAVEKAFDALELKGFIAIDDEEAIARLIVRDAPEPPDGTSEYIEKIGTEVKEAERDDAQVFIAYWNQLHRHYLLKPYDVMTGRDAAIAKRILRNVGMGRAKREMRWFWGNRNQEDSTDIASFSVNFDDISRDRAEAERRAI